jgi:hypothetical protein
MAALATRAPGDVLTVGVSWGVTQRVLYDYLDLASSERTLHMVDPFVSAATRSNRTVQQKYNSDAELVRRQYPLDAKIIFHRAFIPDCLPLDGIERLAFVYMNTADDISESATLPGLFKLTSPGGVIVIDGYAINGGAQSVFDPPLRNLGITPFVLPTGQCVIFR